MDIKKEQHNAAPFYSYLSQLHLGFTITYGAVVAF